MKIRVRLYYSHDMDLTSLYRTGRLEFPEATRQVLEAYACGEAFRLVVGPERKAEARPPHRYCYFDVTLDDKGAAAALIRDIEKGRRTNFIKTLLRQYLCCPIPSCYSVSGNVDLFQTMPEKFQGQMEGRVVRRTSGPRNAGTVEGKAGPKKIDISKIGKSAGGIGSARGEGNDNDQRRGRNKGRKSSVMEAKSTANATENKGGNVARGVGWTTVGARNTDTETLKTVGVGNAEVVEVGDPRRRYAKTDVPQVSIPSQAVFDDGEDVDALLTEMMEEY